MRQTAILAARKAGALLLRHFGKKIPGIRKKEGKSLVTDLDIACNDLIVGMIKKRFPTHNIITEETSPINQQSQYTWHIDPIDGTHNFIRGIPLFGVSIACARNGKVELGVIYLPLFRKMYVAQKGKGAFLNGKRIRVSEKK
ncbi:MAG TPA: inositol monophosphatase family protein, partial [Candidatus Nanoarchaeia archaeon]|nr:inositol monophosphatase family protein [Candidatus Nanoarchaeia archaeon]